MKSVEQFLKDQMEKRVKEAEERNKLIDPKQAVEDEKVPEFVQKVCKCADCESKRQNQLKHLNHPFYQEVREYKEDIAFGQILKGAGKYPNPFIPDQWTGDELADHAMQEMHDGSVYITGMRDRMRKQDAAYNNLLRDYNALKELYSQDIAKIAEFTRFIVETFPDAGNAGDYAVDVATELLKDYNELKRENELLKYDYKEMKLAYKIVTTSGETRHIAQSEFIKHLEMKKGLVIDKRV